MNVGVISATELKEKSIALNMPFANLLRGFVVDEFIRLVQESAFGECIWLAQEDCIGQDSYRKKEEKRIDLFYIESGKKIPKEKVIPGQALLEEVVEAFCDTICQMSDKVEWVYEYQVKPGCAQMVFQATYCDMVVPICVRLIAIKGGKLRSRSITYTPIMGNKTITLLVYASQNRLGECFFEIMSKLELVSDMSYYDTVNSILKTEPVSGRLVMEELYKLCESNKKVLRLKRMEQLEGYMNYKYMERRWEQYRKKHGIEDCWQEVLSRMICFGKPIWTALCQNEIFFEDWMPELGRYLD